MSSQIIKNWHLYKRFLGRIQRISARNYSESFLFFTIKFEVEILLELSLDDSKQWEKKHYKKYKQIKYFEMIDIVEPKLTPFLGIPALTSSHRLKKQFLPSRHTTK